MRPGRATQGRFAELRRAHPLLPYGQAADKPFFSMRFLESLDGLADASALIAIVAGEPEAACLADRLEAEFPRLCSAL